MKKFFLLVVSLHGLCLLSACGGGNTLPPPPPPPVATHFSVTTPATATAGTAFQVTVTALDASNNVVSSYSGTVHISSSDSQAALPANSALANGTGTFSVTFKTAMGQTITAIDTATAAITGISGPIVVSAGAATHLSVNAPNAATAAMAFNFSVTAFDAYNNVVTNCSGMVHFTSTDAQAVLPPNSVLTNGMGSFSATLKTIAKVTITATDSATASITGSSSPISVVSNAVTQFLVATLGNATTRASISVEVKALDAANNVSVGYSGIVHFTSTDGKAILPADATLPNGRGIFSATLETVGNQTITATDTVTASLTGTSSSIGVSAAAALTITAAAPPSGTVGVNYGPSKTETLRCVFSHYRGPHWVCNPCSSPSACASLPPCNGNIFRSPCRETQQSFQGFTFTATGGVPPYSWTASSMPPQLSVNSTNGEITGTPTLAGTYNVAVKVADSGIPQVTTNANYTLVINNPPPPVINTTPAPTAGAVNQPYSFTFSASSAALPLVWGESGGTLPPGLSLSQDGVLSGTPTGTGSFSTTVIAQDSFKQDSAPQNFTIQVYPHGFAPTGSMATPRNGHTATLLNDGKVLVAGGRVDMTHILSTTELFNPTSGTFTPTGSMGTERASHSATLLSDGRMLVAGGHSGTASALATAEIYDFANGSFSPAGSLQAARSFHAATMLKNGKVLVTGGADVTGNALATAEIFDPTTGAFSSMGTMATARLAPTATLLKDGRVLVTGGGSVTAELFDPASGSFALTGSMNTARSGETATLLSDGKVLVAGGRDQNGNTVVTGELFDPVAGTFAPTGSMGTARTQHTATLLKDGTVLLTGGIGATGNDLASAEIFDPNTGFAPTGGMETPRVYHTATLLPTGRVLVTGGTSPATLAKAEVYQ